MPLSFETRADLLPLNTLGITATADYLVHITEPDQVPAALALAHEKQLPWLVLGGGSNIVIGSSHLAAVILKIELKGHTATPRGQHVEIRSGAGEGWDQFVDWTVTHNWQGIEALSLIPGSVGAAPVQNVGAYGQEISSVVTEVEAYDVRRGQLVALTNADCEFGYRDSLFKHAGKRRYIITAVTFNLKSDTMSPLPKYDSLASELRQRGIEHPTIADIRSAVVDIRRAKLPDPAVTPTVGSFFHNPIIPAAAFDELQADHPDIPHWPADDDAVKLSAAWLIEQCGFKGALEDGVGTHPKQALALINPGHRPAAAVLAFRDKVMAAVQDRFGVTLQMEPELIQLPVSEPTRPPARRSR